MPRSIVSPLDWKQRIVDPNTGAPTLQFIRLWQTLFGNEEGTNETADDALTGLDDKADNDIQIIAGGGLIGGGDLNADRTLQVGQGTGITVNADDVAIDTTAEAERIRDVIGTALVAGANVTITVNDPGDQITIASTGGGGGGTGITTGLALQVLVGNVIP